MDQILLEVHEVDQLIKQYEGLSDLNISDEICSKLSNLTDEFRKNLNRDDWNAFQLQDYILLCKLLKKMLYQIDQMISLPVDFNGFPRLNQVKRLLQDIDFDLASSLSIVEKQPPQVLKYNNTFDVTFRCLYSDEDHLSEYEVNCCLISSNQFDNIKNNWHLSSQIPIPSYTTLKNSTAKLKYENSQLCANFKHLKPKRDTEKYCLDEKFALFFYTTILIDNEPIRIWSISNPIVLIIHANQECLAEGTIWWDASFPQISRQFFSIRPMVKCEELTERLAIYIHDLTHHSLDDMNKEFIHNKLQMISDSGWISYQKFHNEPLPGRVFTFWEWFYQLIKFLKPNHIDDKEDQYIEFDYSVQYMWRLGLITGFISKEKSKEILQEQPIGTFLLRFSESQNASLHVAYKNPNGSIEMFAPWDKWQLKKMSVLATISNLEKPQFLYSPYNGLQQLDLIFNPFTVTPNLRRHKSKTHFQSCFNPVLLLA